MTNLVESVVSILLCIGFFAISFLIQALFAFKIKNRIVKCLPVIPAVLLLILCISLIISCITTLNAPPTEEGNLGAAIGEGFGKMFVLIITIIICVPCGGAVLGNIAAWILYAIVCAVRCKRKAIPLPVVEAEAPVVEAEAPVTELPQPPEPSETPKFEENTP